MNSNKEHHHQVAFIAWARCNYPDVLVFAIPNGGARNKLTGFKLKQEGVLAGIPDIFVADGKPGLFIELKQPEKGVISKAQKEVIQRLTHAGYPTVVCYGVDEAKAALTKYLNKENHD